MQKKHHIIETPIGSLSIWAFSSGINQKSLQIHKGNIIPKLPNGMNVDKCIGVVLTCESMSEHDRLDFICQWNNLNEKGYSSSGEDLFAWEWEYNNHLVVIGTEDEDCLKSRLNLKQDSIYSITMNENVITTKLGRIPKKAFISLHYLISWNVLPEKTESSCWYAVDIPHNKLIESINTDR